MRPIILAAAILILPFRVPQGVNMKRNTGEVWIPEAPRHGGCYANEDDFSGDGKIQGAQPRQPSTGSVYHAKQFVTREECAAWCAANPVPAFVPVAHSFAD